MKFPIIHYQLLTPRLNSVSVELNFNPSPIEIHPESPIPLSKRNDSQKQFSKHISFKTHTPKSNDVNCGNPSNNHLNETGLEYPPISLSNTNIFKSQNKHHAKTSFQSN